jgi:hypothetical protein
MKFCILLENSGIFYNNQEDFGKFWKILENSIKFWKILEHLEHSGKF